MQSVASLIADPGVVSLIPQIYHELLTIVILLLSLNQEGLVSHTNALSNG